MYSPKDELKWVDFWTKNKIFEKSVSQRPENKQYVFYDGPPFATGTPHFGHILGLTIKDLFPRYFTMKGFRVERRWVWDCHGLPIENKVEQLKGIKNKKEIETMGVAAFNEACRAQVLEYAQEWKKTVLRMGKWIEFDNAHKTMDNSYMESVWWAFKQMYEDGKVYEGKKILMYCPRCQTPLAKAEIQMDNSYKDVTEPSVVVKFKLKNENNTFILAWTTTPWTLIGNAALAVNGNLDYVKIKVGNEQFILAEKRLSEITTEYEIVERFQGSKLVKKEYEALYHLDTPKKGHYVVDGKDGVTSDDGTGIVHIASYGEFDYELIKQYDLPVFTHIGDDGKIRAGHADWHGLWFKKADPLIIKDLETRGLLYKVQNHKHSYPFCYRCETPLFYNPVDSWFVRIQNEKERLLERNNPTSWHPDTEGSARFKHILETAPDWNISRNRYWATALPVWKCDTKTCREMIVIGSVKELQENAIEKVPTDLDLHKHVVDLIHLTCNVCRGQMTRIPEVIDCWFESGAMPFATQHYPFENKEKFAKIYPADFVSEYVAQVRAWFYYMHVIGVLLFDKAPFKNVVVSGNILAADGSKMSKSKNNYTDPAIIFDTYGADAMRFYLMSSPVTKAQDIYFKDDYVRETYRKVIALTSNTLSFYQMYSGKNDHVSDPQSPNVLDKWVIANLHQTTKTVTEGLDGYDTTVATQALVGFIEDLSTWYLRRSRDRLKEGNEIDQTNAVRTLAHVLHTLSKLMAPITPFISEEIHQALRANCHSLKESVHLEEWPAFDEKKIDANTIQSMEFLRNAVRMGLEQRDKNKMPVRQPLNKATLFGFKLDKETIAIFKDELNVKQVECKEETLDGVSTVVLDLVLTPELFAEGMARELARAIQDLRKQAKLNPDQTITVHIQTDSETQKMLSLHVSDVQEKVRAKTISFESFMGKAQAEVQLKLKEKDAKIWIE